MRHAVSVFCAWLERTPLSHQLQTIEWVIPAVQTLHLLAIAALMGATLVVNLPARSRERRRVGRTRLAPLPSCGALAVVADEVRQLGFHDLRRSHASLLAHACVSTAIAQKLMRHSDPKLTERVYTVVDVETLRREVGRMSFARVVSPRVSPERGQTARKALSSGAERALAASDSAGLRANDPDRDRTCDLAFRKRSLYPTELRGRRRRLYLHWGADESGRSSDASSVIPRARSRSTST